MTVALEHWMNEDPFLMTLNPYRLVGSNAPSFKAGNILFIYIWKGDFQESSKIILFIIEFYG